MKKQRTILMIASSADQVESQRRTRSKAGLFSQIKNDLFMFINKFKNEDSDYVYSSREQKNLLHKQTILNWLRNKFLYSNKSCYLFYSGEGYQNGDWAIETVENRQGDIIKLSDIVQMWEHYGKENLYLFLNYSCLIKIEQLTSLYSKIKNNVYVLSVHNWNQQISDNDKCELFKCLLENKINSVQDYNQIAAKLSENKIQLSLSNQRKSIKLKSDQIKLLFTDISNIKLLTEFMNKINQFSKEELDKIIEQIYEKTEEYWKCQQKEENVKQLYIKHAQQIRSAAKQGNAKACFLLGRAFLNGYGVNENESYSFYWFSKAKEKKQKYSYYGLYLLQQDQEIKQTLLKEGKKAGDFRCIKLIGLQYLKSTELQQEEKQTKVLECIQKLFNLNVCDAHLLSFFLFRNKQSKIFNQEKADEHFQKYFKKVNIDNKPKEFLLGQILYQQKYSKQAVGILKSNYQKFSLSKKQMIKIQYQIAECLFQLRQFEEAKIWYRKAIQKGSVAACNALASLYEDQNEQDLLLQLLYKAIKIDDDQDQLLIANFNLGSYQYNFLNYETAYHYFYEAARLGSRLGFDQCQNMLKEGEGVIKDNIKGRINLEQSQNQPFYQF